MALQMFLNYLEEWQEDDDEEDDDLYVDYFSSQPPLVQACFHGDPDEVRSLLYKKEDINFQVRWRDHSLFVTDGQCRSS